MRPRSRLACWSQVRTAVRTRATAMDANSTASREVCSPIRNMSMYVRLSAGTVAPTATSRRLETTAASIEADVPRSRAGRAPRTPGLRPERRKPAPGSKVSTTPVKLVSNSSIGTNLRPLAGSLTYTPLRPKRRPMPS